MHLNVISLHQRFLNINTQATQKQHETDCNLWSSTYIINVNSPLNYWLLYILIYMELYFKFMTVNNRKSLIYTLYYGFHYIEANCALKVKKQWKAKCSQVVCLHQFKLFNEYYFFVWRQFVTIDVISLKIAKLVRYKVENEKKHLIFLCTQYIT